MLTGLFLFLSSMLSITWSIGFILISIIGVNLYKVSGNHLEQFRKTITWASILNNNEAEGWVAGCWFFGYLYKTESNRGSIKYELYLVCTRRFYNVRIAKIEYSADTDATDATGNNEKSKKKYITFYDQEGNAYWNINYSYRSLELTTLEPRPIQSAIVKKLRTEYDSKSYVVALLHGEPGTGKSMVPYFLAKQILKTSKDMNKVSLVDSFNPFQPGDYLSSLYNKVVPSKDSPLIVVLEEIDMMISKMHNDTLTLHRDISTQISYKTEWNKLFDRIDRLHYPHIYFIMTTNKSAGYFDELDPSYMRPGRVNIKCRC